jgi:hypothetical protein
MRTKKMKAQSKLNIKALAIEYTRNAELGNDTLIDTFRKMSHVAQAIEYLDTWSVTYDVITNEKHMLVGKAKASDRESLKIVADNHSKVKPDKRHSILVNLNKAVGISVLPQGHSFKFLQSKGFFIGEPQQRPEKSNADTSSDKAKAATANEAKFAELAKKQSSTQSELELYKAWVQAYAAQAKANNLPLIDRASLTPAAKPTAKIVQMPKGKKQAVKIAANG